MHPELIILDEPAAALDPKHTAMVKKIVDKLTGEGITVLMATHDVNYAYAWADEVLLFHQGKLLSHGAPETVFRQTDFLKQTNLEQPGVLEIFDNLQHAGILPAGLQAPRTLPGLEVCLIKYLKPDSQNPPVGPSF